jgi:hypothetical protein
MDPRPVSGKKTINALFRILPSRFAANLEMEFDLNNDDLVGPSNISDRHFTLKTFRIVNYLKGGVAWFDIAKVKSRYHTYHAKIGSFFKDITGLYRYILHVSDGEKKFVDTI